MSAIESVRLEPWGPGDLHILERTLGDAAMTTFIGGPETAEKLAERQGRFERLEESGTGHMFKIVDVATGEAMGSVGYWDRVEPDGEVYEAGWFVMTEFQGRGVASAAAELAIAHARAERKHRYLHAYPSVENAASNALCRKLGFRLVREQEFEYPPGTFMRCNDWRLDLHEV
ncbi:MAG TPA: GNAT family N-acetyltransferase [Actinomycetota bacterium]